MLISIDLGYREIVQKFFDSSQQRGTKQRVAEYLNCHASLISQVLSGRQDFTEEQAFGFSRFIGLDPHQSRCFMLIYHRDRAATKDLADFYMAELEDLDQRATQLKKRLPHNKSLPREDAFEYYSNCYYSIIHLFLARGRSYSLNEISDNLSLPIQTTREMTQFLLDTGLVIEKADKYQASPTIMHLGNDKKIIRMHHRNWRLHSIEHLKHLSKNDMRYSGVWTINAQDAIKIRENLVNGLKKNIQTVEKSKNDKNIFGFCLDFYKIM